MSHPQISPNTVARVQSLLMRLSVSGGADMNELMAWTGLGKSTLHACIHIIRNACEGDPLVYTGQGRRPGKYLFTSDFNKIATWEDGGKGYQVTRAQTTQAVDRRAVELGYDSRRVAVEMPVQRTAIEAA